MSWIDQLENSKFVIQTGDGKTYYPLWKNGDKSKEFNNSIFNFIEVEGSLVVRKKAKSGVYSLTFWFQGEDNIQQAQEFEESANDPRAWNIKHPFYGDLVGQPLNLSRDDSSYNVTQITVEFWETITEKFPKRKVSTVDSLKARGQVYSDLSAEVYSSKTDIAPVDVTNVKQNASNFSLRYDSLLDDSNYSDYQQIKSKALQSVDNLTTDPAGAIRDLNTLIAFPGEVGKSVNQRINLILAVYGDVKDILKLGNNRNNKSYFEAIGGAAISALTIVLTNPTTGDYETRTEVENASFQLLELYEDYLQVLDNSQVSINDVNNSFNLGYEPQSELNTAVIEALANLFDLAFDAKQERIVQVESDTNLIVLTHKYMGLDVNDQNLEKFRIINGIKNKSVFKIKKGRSIKYYV